MARKSQPSQIDVSAGAFFHGGCSYFHRAIANQTAEVLGSNFDRVATRWFVDKASITESQFAWAFKMDNI
jgi:hypothetical protein